MILMSYDGSVDAKAAIDSAARLMPGAETTVLTVWEPFIDALTRSGPLGIGVGTGMVGTCVDSEKIDAASQKAALAIATTGAERAAAAGLIAEPRSESRHGAIGNTILSTAADTDAEVIVIGTRGLSGVKSFLLGSVSHAVVQHADRPVLIVPSPSLVERRHDGVEHAVSPA